MLSNLQSWTIIGLASLVWLGLMVVGVAQGGPQAAVDISNVIPFLLMAAWAFERWGWRWSRLHPHLVNEPVLRGTWRGVLASGWKDLETRQSPAPKVVYLAVTQTLTTVKVRLLTNESVSDSVAGSVARTPVGDWAIAYTYSAMPKIERRPGSPPHLGGAILRIVGEPASRIEGEYWTGRSSQGSLNFTAHVDAIAPAFPEAQALFGDDMAAGK